MNSKEPVSICVLGCGTMGIAIISGSLESETNLGHITACVSSEDSGKRLRNLYGDQVNVVVGDNASGIGASNVVLLCTKPQMAKLVLQDENVYEQLKDKILISICAGITLSQLQEWTPESTVVIRAMPNTPCKHRDLALGLFSPLGRCRFMDEKHFDAVTSLSGSGPAFACVVLEALADGGVMMGLPRDVALELAAQAIHGAASMVLTTGAHPAAIKDSVTTPGGCTIAGLLTMEDGKIRSTLARTIQEATQVASQLGKPK